ncbi:hypothetical protein NMG29_02310 [Streptomyces cocklensis]|jgi:hypothetical protein|uniref:Uncharacterized protein n=1 Tax=Actinacidiphila cocklensis TaxID=887465 RepID=A0A9W4DSZ0_9ACTN|nr:hypothetical protein [Actinacidiphila cocklensis]MDD1057072.1 hypothetical protein [Actinacidiphila cocklensis]CAG6393402.1 conserved hypothetical protein [Actinacidiphila cocklensis]
MGASGWDYSVPYQEDVVGAFEGLRRKVFEERDYYWVSGADWRPVEDRLPWPETVEELWADEIVQEAGTHSILDIFRIIGQDEKPDHFTMKQVTEEEALRVLGIRKLTRAHVPRLEEFDHWRWYGRCAVLHDDQGEPQEIYFWGYSGD